jgi:hypothetical protein
MKYVNLITKSIPLYINENISKPLKKSALRLVIKGMELSSSILEEWES